MGRDPLKPKEKILWTKDYCPHCKIPFDDLIMGGHLAGCAWGSGADFYGAKEMRDRYRFK